MLIKKRIFFFIKNLKRKFEYKFKIQKIFKNLNKRHLKKDEIQKSEKLKYFFDDLRISRNTVGFVLLKIGFKPLPGALKLILLVYFTA
ncbi:hypothetical protein [Pedobacter sp. R20-19]|uniref:hypothetical protein n=1 Tax=Pedobacter sp. R20-19 TaxID=1270196 RepID=UPI0004938152|nr:hypothetical protein [Pedobacter sp. R20-19]